MREGGEDYLTVGTLGQLLLTSDAENVILEDGKHLCGLSINFLRGRPGIHGHTVLKLVAGEGRLEMDFSAITNLATELFAVTKVYVGNNFVSRSKVQGTKLTF